jgi:hypothetical protein
MVRKPLIRNRVGGILVRVTRVRSRFPSVLLQRSGAAAPYPVQRRMITGGDSGCRERGFKSCPQDRGAPTVVAIEVLLKGFAGARNQHYPQPWRPAASPVEGDGFVP